MFPDGHSAWIRTFGGLEIPSNERVRQVHPVAVMNRNDMAKKAAHCSQLYTISVSSGGASDANAAATDRKAVRRAD